MAELRCRYDLSELTYAIPTGFVTLDTFMQDESNSTVSLVDTFTEYVVNTDGFGEHNIMFGDDFVPLLGASVPDLVATITNNGTNFVISWVGGDQTAGNTYSVTKKTDGVSTEIATGLPLSTLTLVDTSTSITGYKSVEYIVSVYDSGSSFLDNANPQWVFESQGTHVGEDNPLGLFGDGWDPFDESEILNWNNMTSYNSNSFEVFEEGSLIETINNPSSVGTVYFGVDGVSVTVEVQVLDSSGFILMSDDISTGI